MEFTLPVSLGTLLAIVGVGVAGLAGSGTMALDTTLVMVESSMLVFGLVAFALGMKHGEYRGGRKRSVATVEWDGGDFVSGRCRAVQVERVRDFLGSSSSIHSSSYSASRQASHRTSITSVSSPSTARWEDHVPSEQQFVHSIEFPLEASLFICID